MPSVSSVFTFRIVHWFLSFGSGHAKARPYNYKPNS